MLSQVETEFFKLLELMVPERTKNSVSYANPVETELFRLLGAMDHRIQKTRLLVLCSAW